MPRVDSARRGRPGAPRYPLSCQLRDSGDSLFGPAQEEDTHSPVSLTEAGEAVQLPLAPDRTAYDLWIERRNVRKT